MNNKWVRHIDMALVNLVFILACLAFAAYYCLSVKLTSAAVIIIMLLALIAVLNVVIFIIRHRYRQKRAKALAFYAGVGEDGVPPVGSVADFRLPLVFLSEGGDLIWANPLFREIFDSSAEMRKELREIYLSVLKGRTDNPEIDTCTNISFCGRSYYMLTNVVRAEKSLPDAYYIMLYFIDDTELGELRKKYDSRRTAIAEIAVDSYDEIFQASGEAVVNEISVELGKIFDRWIGDTGAVVKKLVRDRYLLICEDTALSYFERSKFSVLDMAKRISVGNRIQVTLSIGVGAHGDSAAENYTAAAQALELALSRGGDQAVSRRDGRDYYYGGSNIDPESINKVKARVLAQTLRAEIEKSSKVLIMGHSQADMDALGGALCAYRACCFANIPAFIVLNDSNPSIDAFYRRLMHLNEYKQVFIDTSYALNLADDDTLLIVVDTSRPDRTECPELLKNVTRVAVIDHHRKAADYIRGAVLDYTETYASSTGELLVEVLKYMAPDADIPLVEAEATYTGMLVDTKNFTVKTGSRTFEVAAFLRARGVDTVAVRQYFQPNLETYSSVSKITSGAYMKYGRIAIARCGAGIKSQKLVTAMAADQLLNISGVDASFVLADGDGEVSISGRSWGEINVQVILEKLGGGGHLTSAGASVKNAGPEEAEQQLLKAIDEYMTE